MTTKTEKQLEENEFMSLDDYSEIMLVNLKNKTRDPETVWARYAIWLYLMNECNAKLSEVSRHFGWHHSTILYGIKQMKQKLEIDDSLAFEQALRIYRADPHKRYPIQRGRAQSWLI